MGAFMGGRKSRPPGRPPTRWLFIALFLGLLFVAGQYVAWVQLRSEGLYLATNPNSSFFYLLMVIHALHVLGGLGGLVRVVHRLNKSILRKHSSWTPPHITGTLWTHFGCICCCCCG